MARFALVAMILAAACAPKPMLKAPGVALYESGAPGHRQWRLFVRFLPSDRPFPSDRLGGASVIFDDEIPEKAFPVAPLTMTKKGFDATVLPKPQPKPYLSYRLSAMTDAGTWTGARGVVYVFCREREEAYPLVWWGLDGDPGFDRATPAENWTKLKVLFADQKKK